MKTTLQVIFCLALVAALHAVKINEEASLKIGLSGGSGHKGKPENGKETSGFQNAHLAKHISAKASGKAGESAGFESSKSTSLNTPSVSGDFTKKVTGHLDAKEHINVEAQKQTHAGTGLHYSEEVKLGGHSVGKSDVNVQKNVGTNKHSGLSGALKKAVGKDIAKSASLDGAKNTHLGESKSASLSGFKSESLDEAKSAKLGVSKSASLDGVKNTNLGLSKSASLSEFKSASSDGAKSANLDVSKSASLGLSGLKSAAGLGGLKAAHENSVKTSVGAAGKGYLGSEANKHDGMGNHANNKASFGVDLNIDGKLKSDHHL